MSEFPKPLWPMPDGWGKPFIRVWKGRFHVFLPDVTGGGWHPNGFDTHEQALDFVYDELQEALRATEYVERREALAEFLMDLVYGTGKWELAVLHDEQDLLLNYRLDADDIIKANPHLLSLEERERLAGQIPELAYP